MHLPVLKIKIVNSINFSLVVQKFPKYAHHLVEGFLALPKVKPRAHIWLSHNLVTSN